MSQLAPSGSLLQIEDQIDTIGQKYRAQRIVRGAMLWVGCGAAVTIVAAFLANYAGQGIATKGILFIWIGWLIASAWQWFARPMLIRPDPVEVARLVESRVEGLHNGLTNSLLLSRRDDIADSPFLPALYDEILRTTQGKPLGQAVRMSDLRREGQKVGILLAPLLILVCCFPSAFGHGFSQLVRPTAFVPRMGAAEIIDLTPKDVTIVAGQPLEITLAARVAAPLGSPVAKLIFDKAPDTAALPGSIPANADMTATPVSDSTDTDAAAVAAPTAAQTTLQYNYRVDHVDVSARYRVEVGGTQSPWYTVTVVKQVKLSQISLHIVPPLYTGDAATDMVLKPEEIAHTVISVDEGSEVKISAIVDTPVTGALLQAGDDPPSPMEVDHSAMQLSAELTVLNDTPLAVLPTEGNKQIIGRLPDDPLVIHVVRDMPPKVEMKWPTQDVTVAPDAELKISALLSDDHGVVSARVLTAASPTTQPTAAQQGQTAQGGPAAPSLAAVHEEQFPPATGVKAPKELTFVLQLSPDQRQHGKTVQVQVEATDGRQLPFASAAAASPASGSGATGGGPQVTRSPVFTITFADPKIVAEEKKQSEDALREKLAEMLKKQQDLHTAAVAAGAGGDDKDAMGKINTGQTELRTMMQSTAETFTFEPEEKVIQKTLLMLAFNPGQEAVDFSGQLMTEPVAARRDRLSSDLQSRQRRIIDTLTALLSLLHATQEPTTQPGLPGDQLVSQADAFKKLNDELKAWMKEQQRVLDQTAGLAKKPVDNWDDADKKKLDDLKQAQDKLDAFMQEKIADFSKNSEQDMANSSLLKDLLQVYSETTMAKDALSKKAAEMAVADEDMGLEKAKEMSSNIEKWLSNTPDRTQWNQEDPTAKTDLPMPELPKELEDMVGELMEQQEDLFDQMEDSNANWADSMDKGVGWDAADGPIADMSAKGVTGNQLPNNNEMNGRSGEGRSGKSQGEFVGDTATGKGGRNTPTRLDPTPFQKGQIKDSSKDPTGGATGGGKMSGAGAQGLEGPVPPQQKEQMQRLATKQAELRNKAERLNLQYKLARYDNYKLLESIALMRRTESDLEANRYQNAMRDRDVILDSMDESRLLLGGEVHAERDTTPTAGEKLHQQIDDAMKGELPAAWSDALKQYYQKLSQ
jgi:hypothetical protein